jgi:hypothetical protein
MGQRVSHYKIGLAVDASETSGIYSGLISLLERDGIKDNFAAYRNDFSEVAVRNKLSTFIHKSLQS